VTVIEECERGRVREKSEYYIRLFVSLLLGQSKRWWMKIWSSQGK